MIIDDLSHTVNTCDFSIFISIQPSLHVCISGLLTSAMVIISFAISNSLPL